MMLFDNGLANLIRKYVVWFEEFTSCLKFTYTRGKILDPSFDKAT